MLPKKPRRQDNATLIWEYLEGEISPSRADRLSRVLAERPQAREQLVESAVLHGMLFSFFAQDRQARQCDAGQAVNRQKPRRPSAA